jgi:putative tryptophan/tyrosine transport system substrate-binding protein
MLASRRAFLAILAALASWRPDARAQSANAKRVVVLFSGTPEMDEPASAPFFLELRRVGWVEGRNITYERLYARGSREKVAELAKAAVAKRPDLIFAPTAFAALSAVKATSTIPVVFNTVSDPMVVGLVASLPRPGANATGTFQIQADLVAKKFEMLRECMPHAQRVGVVLEARGIDYAQQKQRHLDAGRGSGFEVLTADFTSFDQIASVLSKFRQERVEVVTVPSSFTLLSRRKEFVELTRTAAFPLVAHRAEWAEAGAVMTYGADVHDTLRRTALIAHRILNGARPAETPVEQASKFELVVNLRAAGQHGVAFPKVFLARADRVIE